MNKEEVKKLNTEIVDRLKFDILTDSKCFLNQLEYYQSVSGIRLIQALENYIRRETRCKHTVNAIKIKD